MGGKKRIVVCSDGTGQYGGMLNPSNVWRTYQALDKQSQSCLHDDGVGSGGGRAIKIIGGAFGFGISRNLKEIYRFLINQYDADVDPDLYFFGFSRGAFTVRVLAQMVCMFGIPDMHGKEPDEIDKICDRILKSYKKANQELKEGGKSKIADEITQKYSTYESNGKAVDSRKVHFLGVWDTVEAMGLPLDEFTQAFNVLFPLKFGDNKPHSNVEHIYQALAIDEERRTFRPKLFDVSDLQGVEKDRVKQVWFPGCHAHVGGGYAKDQLAFGALLWMIKNAEQHDLKFDNEMVQSFRTQASCAGSFFDSRTGPRMFYRYGPRRIAKLCEDHGVDPVLHKSAFDRIQYQVGGYSPSALHGIVESEKLKLDPVPFGDPTVPEECETESTVSLNMEQAIHLTWVRWFIFYGMFLSALFGIGWGVANGLMKGLIKPEPIKAFFSWMPESLVCLEQWLLKFVKSFVPEFVAFIFEGFVPYDGLLITMLAIFCLFFIADQIIKDLIMKEAAKGLRELRVAIPNEGKTRIPQEIHPLDYFFASPACMFALLTTAVYGVVSFCVWATGTSVAAKEILWGGVILLGAAAVLVGFVGFWYITRFFILISAKVLAGVFGWFGKSTLVQKVLGIWRRWGSPVFGFFLFFSLLIFLTTKLWARVDEFFNSIGKSKTPVIEKLDAEIGEKIAGATEKLQEK